MAIEQSDPRFEVYAGLVHRALSEMHIVSGTVYRVDGTESEFEILAHGDEAEVDGLSWRITGRNPEAGCFFLFAPVNISVGDITIQCRPTDPIEQLRREFSLWETTYNSKERDNEIDVMRRTMRSFFYHLVNDDQITAYLNSAEPIKQSYREAGCGYGLPIFEPALDSKTEQGEDAKPENVTS